ncbi:30S ribosomal protein S2 [[Mycoplasma] testudinis]|uniref:30S ribosomal protein S2 n=1 Tax=[Mycoplasma] testudinis TaxID=33924 RepID=UPI000AD0BB4A|nr:30S ribosomal protein S2 [[Mycoplasma] testudinis]
MSENNFNNPESAPTNRTAEKAEISQPEASQQAPAANSGQTRKPMFTETELANGEKPLVSGSKIMEVGGHIGFSKRRWNPKMKPYIYSKKPSGTQYDVLNVPLMQEKLQAAYEFIKEIATNNGVVLFVGTKTKQVQELIKEIAKRIDINYISQRWLGGTLTNFKTISNSIKQLNNLITEREKGLGQHTKKEQMLIIKKIDKLEKFFGGIKTMRGLPNVIVVDDPIHEKNAVTEAKKLNIPVVAIANTNADPNLIDYLVPGNNASIRSVTLFMNLFADAVAIAQGKQQLFAYKPDEEIVIAQVVRKERDPRFVVNRSNSYHGFQNRRFNNDGNNRYGNNSTNTTVRSFTPPSAATSAASTTSSEKPTANE